ncbi:hypothetical protein D3C84_823260 [compost metagenome]
MSPKMRVTVWLPLPSVPSCTYFSLSTPVGAAPERSGLMNWASGLFSLPMICRVPLVIRSVRLVSRPPSEIKPMRRVLRSARVRPWPRVITSW